MKKWDVRVEKPGTGERTFSVEGETIYEAVASAYYKRGEVITAIVRHEDPTIADDEFRS